MYKYLNKYYVDTEETSKHIQKNRKRSQKGF